MRPQFVKKEHNHGYHKLISEFEKITGMGGILNTSFNLHGWPIVNTQRMPLRHCSNPTLITFAQRLSRVEENLAANRFILVAKIKVIHGLLFFYI